MDDLGHMLNESDILSTLEHLNNEEKTIQDEIDQLLGSESELEGLVGGLVKHMSNVSLIESDAERLSNLITFTSSLSENVSYKIRSFDLVRKRVGECLKQVEDIIDLRACTDGIQKSLMNEDYEDAARHIYRFLSMDESMLRKSTSEDVNGNMDSSSLEQSFAKLHEAEQKLKSIVMTRFDEAVVQKDVASVERFFKIFPLINHHREGLNRFAQYLTQRVNELMSTHKKTATSRSSAFLEKLSYLYETIAQTIDIHYPLIETYYGPGHLFHVMKILQKECDRHGKLIVNEFKNEKNLSTLFTSISKLLKNSTMPTPGNSGGSQQSAYKIDAKEIDKHLNEMMFVINRSQTYLHFINNRLLDDIESAQSNDQNKPSQVVEGDKEKVEGMLRDCQLTQSIHDLNSIYVLLEEYFLKESIYKAIQLDAVDKTSSVESGAITSSMLDDTFFIIKKCLKRSISCGSLNVILAMINNVVAALETYFFDVINEKIRFGFPALTLSTLDLSNAYNTAVHAGRYLQAPAEMDKLRTEFIASLNNLNVACDYIKRLCTTIIDDVNNAGLLPKNQVELFESCLGEFSALSTKFRQLSTVGIQQLFNAVFKSTVKAMIDAFTSASHQMSDEDIFSFESTEGLRPYMQTFLMNLASLVQTYRKQLCLDNFDILIGIVAFETSNRLYKALFKCNFNKVSGRVFGLVFDDNSICVYSLVAFNWIAKFEP